MNKELMESMLRHGEYEKLIAQLQNKVELTEEERLALSRAYVLSGDENRALKSAVKLDNEAADGSIYKTEAKKILNAILNEALDTYIEEFKASFRKDEQEETVEQVYSERIEELFEGIVGMKEAKNKLQTYLDSCKLNRERVDRDFDDFIERIHNFAIIGKRGSGKTILAEIICEMLGYEEGSIQSLMARDIKERKSLDALFKSSDVAIVIENLEDCLFSAEPKEGVIIDILNGLEDLLEQNAENDGCKFIFTGTAEAFEKMKLLNPAIEKYIFDFINIEKYTEDELWELMKVLAEADGFRISPECEEDLKRWLTSESKLSDFSNTIALDNLLKEAKKNLAIRYKKFEEEEGLGLYWSDEKVQQKLCKLEPEDFTGNGEEQTLEELCNELDAMTGLARVKKEVRTQISKVNIALKAAKAGANRKSGHGTLHMAFVGEPGTGKTTVAKMIGKIYCALGVLPGDEVYTVSRADLVSQYIGGTARCVREVCQRADGGVLFVDEAYSLVNSDQDSYGKEAVDTLIQEMENRRDTMMVILAGYEEPMMEFLKANPGFKSRVPNIIHFDDYELEEMVQIFEYMVKADGYYLTAEALSKLSGLLSEKSKEADFGNARGVRNVLDQVINAQSERLEQESATGEVVDYDAITAADIQAIQDKIDTEEKTIDELLAELYALEGLQGVKDKVQAMVNAMKYRNLVKNRAVEHSQKQGTMHLVFSGNPGTGKSTVANLLGQIYVKLGVLKKNTFILAKRFDLVAQYMGQTAARVANKVAEADGGILFIDEAYQLYNGDRDSYGEEAIGTLLSLVEEKRDSLMVILAGYTENMEDFMAVNPGLRSRFPNVIEFTDYSVSELLIIFEKMVQKDGLTLEEGVLALVEKEICQRKEKDEREFANARGVRNILEQISLRQQSRIIIEEENGIPHTDEELVRIKKEDV